MVKESATLNMVVRSGHGLSTLPETFPAGLFAELDCRPDLGIINHGVSMTTLEDVFLRLEAEAEVDQAGKESEVRSKVTEEPREPGD